MIKTLGETVDEARQQAHSEDDYCTMCAAGDLAVNGIHRGEHKCGFLKRITELERDLKVMGENYQKYMDMATGLGLQNTIMREALEFYADTDNHKASKTYKWFSPLDSMSAVYNDKGYKARQALKKLQEQSHE